MEWTIGQTARCRWYVSRNNPVWLTRAAANDRSAEDVEQSLYLDLDGTWRHPSKPNARLDDSALSFDSGEALISAIGTAVRLMQVQEIASIDFHFLRTLDVEDQRNISRALQRVLNGMESVHVEL